jgi:hypothetical protein
LFLRLAGRPEANPTRPIFTQSFSFLTVVKSNSSFFFGAAAQTAGRYGISVSKQGNLCALTFRRSPKQSPGSQRHITNVQTTPSAPLPRPSASVSATLWTPRIALPPTGASSAASRVPFPARRTLLRQISRPFSLRCSIRASFSNQECSEPDWRTCDPRTTGQAHLFTRDDPQEYSLSVNISNSAVPTFALVSHHPHFFVL